MVSSVKSYKKELPMKKEEPEPHRKQKTSSRGSLLERIKPSSKGRPRDYKDIFLMSASTIKPTFSPGPSRRLQNTREGNARSRSIFGPQLRHW
eukprot:CAMPEP_0195511468 /NCGR_PEP_ID=MMETSP0794_2-20130614/3773_1 /TAXON_ID=515487 /ORGANISM="Stephanopyxis turris, Strain CCMP 815" /LENGTH=92 /DNA_ID=CAMNT_0040639063 /DNA_START=126 /DNA_END=401 /DNA_ORIENTATION=+